MLGLENPDPDMGLWLDFRGGANDETPGTPITCLPLAFVASNEEEMQIPLLMKSMPVLNIAVIRSAADPIHRTRCHMPLLIVHEAPTTIGSENQIRQGDSAGTDM